MLEELVIHDLLVYYKKEPKSLPPSPCVAMPHGLWRGLETSFGAAAPPTALYDVKCDPGFHCVSKISDFGQHHDGNFSPQEVGKEAISIRYNGAFEVGCPARGFSFRTGECSDIGQGAKYHCWSSNRFEAGEDQPCGAEDSGKCLCVKSVSNDGDPMNKESPKQASEVAEYGNRGRCQCCKAMEDTEMPERVEALLQNTLAHITQMGCSKETRRRMKQRLHRRLDLLVKGDRDQYDRHLERFHQMLEESRGQLGPSKRMLMREVQEPRRRYHLDLAVDFSYGNNGYNGYESQPNYAFFQTQPLMRPGPQLSYPNYVEADYREDPIPGWNPWSADIYGPSLWESPPVGPPAARRSRSVPRSSLRTEPGTKEIPSGDVSVCHGKPPF
eukprot:s2009_g4.t1